MATRSGRKRSLPKTLVEAAPAAPPRKRPQRKTTTQGDAADSQPAVNGVLTQLQLMQQQMQTMQESMIRLQSQVDQGGPRPTAPMVPGVQAAVDQLFSPPSQGALDTGSPQELLSLDPIIQAVGEVSPYPEGMRNLSSVPLGSLLDGKIKAKIWSKQFIDLAIMLASPTESFTLTLDRQSQLPHFKVTEKASKRIESIEQWTSAFMVYMAVYVEKHLHEAQAMLKYMSTIRKMALTMGGNVWAKYDEDFRKLRAHANLPWEEKHQDLYLENHPYISNY
jgi:hypothetical protein